MSRRQRQKRRKHRNGGFRKGFLVALSVGIVAGFLGVLGVVGYVIGVAASAPSIDSLKPIDHGQTSVVYAADGKLREAKLAEELEREHNKTWILTNYLNNVSYGTVGGSTAVGVQAAARVFFDKPASQLNLVESAT